MATKNVSVVLAHGAWADGSSWARVVTALKVERTTVSAWLPEGAFETAFAQHASTDDRCVLAAVQPWRAHVIGRP